MKSLIERDIDIACFRLLISPELRWRAVEEMEFVDVFICSMIFVNSEISFGK